MDRAVFGMEHFIQCARGEKALVGLSWFPRVGMSLLGLFPHLYNLTTVVIQSATVTCFRLLAYKCS